MRALVALCLLLALPPMTARAGDTESRLAKQWEIARDTVPSKPEGQGWHRSTNFGVYDSDCIGDPKTSECVVDTLMACVGTGKYDLCRIAFARKFPDATDFTNQYPFIYDYRIASLKPFKKSDLPKGFRGIWWKPAPGDLLAIVLTRECTYYPESWQRQAWVCSEPDDMTKTRQYLHLARKNGRWVVKDEEPWSNPDDVDETSG